ncbi:hypothetical protein [Flavobacterium suzhouense]|uniref:PH (Pleckstrin Homology) domain-containing protein n=1 Tax=Flavobacterium suzhouense TaxID=1529638 RepID=A0ABW5NTR0_9FLAO
MSTFLFQEIRKSLIVIRIKRTEKIIEDNTITINSFLGLGKDMIYHIKEFDGFKTSSIMSKGTLYNYIFLIKNGKRVVKISDGYYSNYQEMSDFFKTNLNDLGHVDGNAFSEMIDLFKK